MTAVEIIKTLMKEKGFSMNSLATKLGYTVASGVSEKLRRPKSMRVDSLYDMLEAMDCEIIIRDKIGKKTQYVLTKDKAE